jgi:flagellin
VSYSIQTNVNSIIAQENLRVNSDFQSRTIQRLTSGYRINNSSDDAAGLAVANKFRSDVTELEQGVRNANDGISALQIVDGGLNNVSKMLDRLKTLATQSASATFSGDRGTLNTEYQTLLHEIDRQAQDIGLGTGAVGGRYGKTIDVYIGGGVGIQQNAKVTVDMAGSQVDSTGLGILNTNILGGNGVSVDTTIMNGNTTFLAGGKEDFTVETATGSKTVTINGGTAGISGQQVVDQFNEQLNGTGISAQIGSDGTLQFFGDQTAFVVTAAAAGATAGTAVAAASKTNYNTNMAQLAGGVDISAGLASAATLNVMVNGRAVSVNLAAGDDQNAAKAKLNSALNAFGVYATLDPTGKAVELQGTAAFSVSGATTVIADGASSAVPPSSQIANSTAALAALSNAVTTLGAAQGKVGTGQNQLQYAVQLAQSQIASFSAAESRIRDADIASEAANLTKAQVLQQSSLAALAQANQAPQAILALLRS